MKSFSVVGKLSNAEYVFQSHSLASSTNGNYPCFAHPLFAPHCNDIYSFALMKCRVFNLQRNSTSFIHAFRVILVTKSQFWIGCIGVAEYNFEPNYENIDQILDIDKYFTLLPFAERETYYDSSCWTQCLIPTVDASENEMLEVDDTNTSHKIESTKAARIIGFEIPKQTNHSSVAEKEKEELPAAPIQMQSFRFPAPMDDLWLSDFFPLQIENEETLDPDLWNQMDKSVFQQRFWYVYKSEKFPKYMFPSVFHRFVAELLHNRENEFVDSVSEKERWLSAVFDSIHGVAFARNQLPEKTKEKIMKEWSLQSSKKDSLLNQLRFERFDFFFERLGKPILELIPWGQFASSWTFCSPVLENTLRECLLWYAVDHLMIHHDQDTKYSSMNSLSSLPSCRYLRVRHAIRLYEDWDINLLREFCTLHQMDSMKELKVWKEYRNLFLNDQVLSNDMIPQGNGDWIYDEFVPLLAKQKLANSTRAKETVKWMNAIFKTEKKEDAKKQRMQLKVCIVRDLVRGNVQIDDYLSVK